MIFQTTELSGLFSIDPERHNDERGYFARTWCREAFAAHGLVTEFAQSNASFNLRRGILRGLHYQAAPHIETRLVSCVRGRAYDVAVDLRPGSATQGRWWATEISAANGRMVYIPEGFAHGFQTLEDDTELHYLVTPAYHADAVRELCWDDPTLAIDWPIPSPILSERDETTRSFVDFTSSADFGPFPFAEPAVAGPTNDPAAVMHEIARAALTQIKSRG